MIVDLDSPPGQDPIRVGSKAAALAVARRAGAPVLPGFVVTGEVSLRHMRIGADALESRGSGGARLEMTGEPIDFRDELVAFGSALGEHLVARSSTVLETSGEWSGAFSSYVGITPNELPKAVVGCWASAFSVGALERQQAAGVEPGSFPMSVLIQPALEPEAGGWAELGEDDTVTVYGTKGSPAPLIQGWERGHRARYDRRWSGEELIDLVGVGPLDSIRDLLGTANIVSGANRCEWALSGQVWGLQFGKIVPSHPVSPLRLQGGVPDELLDVIRTVVLAPGTLGEEMVLPWGIGGLPDVDLSTNGAPASIDHVRDLCRELTEEVWGLPWPRALSVVRETIADLRGTDPGSAVSRIRSLRPPDPERAARLLFTLRVFREELAERGLVADQYAGWHLDLDSIELALDGHSVAVSHRLGIGRWEPLVASVILGSVEGVVGAPASPGIGAGRRFEMTTRHQRRVEQRGIVTASRPLPSLASLLWDAAGVVTVSGSPAAHLFEAARALRVPAVAGVDLGPNRDQVVAVDGATGSVATLDLERSI